MSNKEINDLVKKWHESSSTKEIHEYLGMTLKEYSKWVETRINPKKQYVLDNFHIACIELRESIEKMTPREQYEMMERVEAKSYEAYKKRKDKEPDLTMSYEKFHQPFTI